MKTVCLLSETTVKLILKSPKNVANYVLLFLNLIFKSKTKQKTACNSYPMLN